MCGLGVSCHSGIYQCAIPMRPTPSTLKAPDAFERRSTSRNTDVTSYLRPAASRRNTHVVTPTTTRSPDGCGGLVCTTAVTPPLRVHPRRSPSAHSRARGGAEGHRRWFIRPPTRAPSSSARRCRISASPSGSGTLPTPIMWTFSTSRRCPRSVMLSCASTHMVETIRGSASGRTCAMSGLLPTIGSIVRSQAPIVRRAVTGHLP